MHANATATPGRLNYNRQSYFGNESFRRGHIINQPASSEHRHARFSKHSTAIDLITHLFDPMGIRANEGHTLSNHCSGETCIFCKETIPRMH